MSSVATAYLQGCESPLATLTPKIAELQSLQEKSKAELNKQHDQFATCQKGIVPLSYTFGKMPTYRANVVRMRKQMMLIQARVTRLRARSKALEAHAQAQHDHQKASAEVSTKHGNGRAAASPGQPIR